MKAWRIVSAMIVALAVVIALVVYAWVQMGDVQMSWRGVLAMIGGVVVSLGLGIGLMALVFYSSRSGRDDDAGHR